VVGGGWGWLGVVGGGGCRVVKNKIIWSNGGRSAAPSTPTYPLRGGSRCAGFERGRATIRQYTQTNTKHDLNTQDIEREGAHSRTGGRGQVMRAGGDREGDAVASR
jgi:hypothetical protein